MTEQERFANMLLLPPDSFHIEGGVGTLSEKYLHALLKHFYESNTDFHEVGVGSFTADICVDDKIIEIQTRGFNRLREKLDFYLQELYDVTVVYPLPKNKYLIWVDPENGEVTNRRRSPKIGSIYDSVWELVKIMYFLDWNRFHLKLFFCDLEEYRNLDGYGKHRKYRSTRLERVPLKLCEIIELNCPEDYRIFIPDGLKESFTIDEFAKAAKIRYETAQTTIKILTYLELMEKCGKQGRFNIYKIKP